ncbi:gamma-glutamylcyclotransferase [Kiloniella antarctica]|uniref:glutathione-specific gamma-glutamylcyclotransferase n=1 Tax=Kiloniella antarctica TaxID=1550907 RepID=A0ABW5BEA9_9PROT
MSTPELRAFYDSKISLEEGKDFWVFGYGSLMWNPGFPHMEVQPATLENFHRHFCIYSFFYRGTPECPGLVLGLDGGGSCVGMAYRVPAAERKLVLDYLFEREMISGVYHPGQYDITLENGTVVNCLTFVADSDHEQYAGRLTQDELIPLLLQGVGSAGRCIEYLDNTVKHLKALSIDDQGLHDLQNKAHAALKRIP